MKRPMQQTSAQTFLLSTSRWCLGFLLVTLSLFFLYRIAFLTLFVPDAPLADSWRVYLYGMRLDLALVAIEFILLGVLFLLIGRISWRGLVAILAALTPLHAVLAVVNLLFFRERGQHFWEMLLVNLTRPDEVFVAVWPFMVIHLVSATLVVAALLLYGWSARRVLRRLPELSLDLWRPRRRILRCAGLLFLLFVLNLDATAYQEKKYWRLGWIPMPTASQYYMRFGSYHLNAAVVNPLHDFFRFYLPATLAGFQGEKTSLLSSEEALSLTQQLLGCPPGDRQYPLLRAIPRGPELGLKNVILLQIEGLSAALVNYEEEGRPVTPFLNQLAAEGLYFSNVMQSFNATDGAVLATAGGSHKAFFNKNWQYFLPIEINGYLSSLPHLLGRHCYRHLALHGFENRREAFSTFFRNQGFEAVDLEDLARRLGELGGQRNALGLFDGILLDETVEILAGLGTNFTAHLVTATTHSPWVVPDGVESPFADKKLNAFHYLDQSLARFVRDLEQRLPDFANTLLVVVADHTSILTEGGTVNQLRVPVIFYSPKLAHLPGKKAIDTEVLGSQVDVVPTVLQLLDGEHQYAGMGTSLMQTELRPGVISSSRYDSYYLKDDWVFWYSPYRDAGEKYQLLKRSGREFSQQNVAGEYPEQFERLRKEYFALYETSNRLVREKRLLPIR